MKGTSPPRPDGPKGPADMGHPKRQFSGTGPSALRSGPPGRLLGRRGPVRLVGGADQLPSIGPAAVLADLLRADVPFVPSVHLSEVFRQARGSDLVRCASAVNQGRFPADLRKLPASLLSQVSQAPGPGQIGRAHV